VISVSGSLRTHQNLGLPPILEIDRPHPGQPRYVGGDPFGCAEQLHLQHAGILDAALQLGRGALGDDDALVDDGDPVAELVRSSM